MDHGPNIVQEEKSELSAYKSKIGLILFAVYSAIYVSFILINTFIPRVMAIRVVFGLNLAVVYGFGLILTAIVLGLVYNRACTKRENQTSADNTTSEAQK